MNKNTNDSNGMAANGCGNDRNAAMNDAIMKMSDRGKLPDGDEGNMTEQASGNAAATEAMDDESSSTSEEVMSGTQSDQTTANISSNGGYSGDYESISDSSSGASKKRKVALGVSDRHRRDAEEEKEENPEDLVEEDAVSRGIPSSLAEDDDDNMSVEYDNIRRHHHHRHHVETDGKNQPTSNTISNKNHYHHHHHRDRHNEARDQQVNRQINEIMNLYNVSLQAHADANVQAGIIEAAAVAADRKEDDAISKNDSSLTSSVDKKEPSTAKCHYQVHSNEQPLIRSSTSASRHQLDPRNELAKSYKASQSSTAGLELPKEDLNNSDGRSNEPEDHPNQDCYNNLMEACRPFFQDSECIMKSKKIPMLPTTTNNQSQAGSDEAQSSSGFTSFFTTTKSDSNTNAGEGSSSQSEFSQNNKKRGADEGSNEAEGNPIMQEQADTPQPEHGSEHHAHNLHHNHHIMEGAYLSDSSSMVVLARMKRKYKSQRGQEDEKHDATKHTSKRVRIETVALDAAKSRPSNQKQQQQNGKQPESSSLSSGLSTSVNSSGSEGGNGGGGEAKATSTSVEDRSKTDSQSGSAENSKQQTARTVTDTSGTTTANNSSGSGTGSGNDADQTNNTESGSQIEGNSNSDDKTPTYCEKDSLSDNNTVAAINGDANKKAEALPPDKPMIHHHNHGGKKIPVVDHTPKDPADSAIDEQEQPTPTNNAVITKEEKLIEKKRKRMSARKEYEEDLQRQMRDSSESSSNPKYADVFEPGKPVTLEDVLQFSKTARLLVQALPPFLAVHTNAAFTLLTGIESHTMIGQPVSSIISIAQENPPNKESDSSGSDNTNNKDALSSLSGSIEGNEGQNGSASSNANQAIQHGQEQPANDNNGETNAQLPTVSLGFRIDRLIVARGYGAIHNVQVKSLKSEATAHAIEGSEVKVNEGKSSTKRKKKDDKIFCRMSVSPVVTNIETWDRKCEGHVESNKDHASPNSNKRRKHNGPVVKHYLIQLESMDGPCTLAKRSSFSSTTDTTVEAQLLGITRSEVVARRVRMGSTQRSTAQEGESLSAQRNRSEVNFTETDSQDENASAVEHVATCG